MTKTELSTADFNRLLAECRIGGTGRPFLCCGRPTDARIAVIGINPATTTPFDPYWDAEAGVYDKHAWLKQYRVQHAGKRTPTRDRIELLIGALSPLPVIELNLYHEASRSEASLTSEKRSTAVFEFMLKAVQPRILIVHGRSPREHLERLIANDGARAVETLRSDDFTSTHYLGMPVEVFVATKHLAYVPGGATYVQEIGRRVRERHDQLSGGAKKPTVER